MTIDLFGCIKCSFGYTGIVVNDSDKNYHGYIDKCEEINKIQESPLDGECELNVWYQGYTTNATELLWNKAPLDSYLSCYKCKDT